MSGPVDQEDRDPISRVEANWQPGPFAQCYDKGRCTEPWCDRENRRFEKDELERNTPLLIMPSSRGRAVFSSSLPIKRCLVGSKTGSLDFLKEDQPAAVIGGFFSNQ